MDFEGRDPTRSKIIIDNKIIEQLISFSSLGNVICYKNEMDIDKKLNIYLKITGIRNNVLKQNKTRLKL
jgi:hypothetical protein